MTMLILGLLIIGGGYWLFAQTAPEWHQAQSWLAQLARGFDPALRSQFDALRTQYYGSIAAMTAGGLLVVAGLFERLLAELRKK